MGKGECSNKSRPFSNINGVTGKLHVLARFGRPQDKLAFKVRPVASML
jgi:hypothetical protein